MADSATVDAPNVVLVHCHDLGRYLGCYGRDVDTPAIDALADDGVRFDSHFCSAPQCSPSRGSMMTGKHPQSNGLLGLTNVGGWELPRDEDTIPSCLGRAGYESHLFGVQHEVDEHPERLGYDEIHRGSNHALEVADLFDDAASDLADGGPFFASVGFFEPHRAFDTYRMDSTPEGAYDQTDPDAVDVPPYLPDEPAVRQDVADLQDLISATVDPAVERVRTSLRDAGVADETVIVFTADHGLAMPGAKGTCYDPGLETALIVTGPGVATGETREELLSNVDLLPTIADLTSAEVPADVDGRSFAPLLAVGGDARSYDERDAVFAGMTWHGAYVPMRAVRTERYKYVRNFTRYQSIYMPNDVFASAPGQAVAQEVNSTVRPAEELYDLADDPDEEHNLLEDALFERGSTGQVPYDYEGVLADCRDRVEDWMERTDDPLLNGDVPAPRYERGL
jgi:arylsulfatase A-like enzyme